MTCCPFCGARGAKMADQVTVKDMSFQADYCGKCGRNWPPELAARVESDGVPPSDAPLPARVTTDRSSRAAFGARVAALIDRISGSPEDFKHKQAGDR